LKISRIASGILPLVILRGARPKTHLQDIQPCIKKGFDPAFIEQGPISYQSDVHAFFFSQGNEVRNQVVEQGLSLAQQEKGPGVPGAQFLAQL
jgi:hypothetical protein